jgi:uncharacterized phage protein gp47/JayE
MSLTEEGFDRPRLNEIKADYDQRFTDALGPINTSPDAVAGQIIGIFVAALDDAYEALQNTYDSMYPFSAEGTSLDGAVSFVGLERLAATPTTVVAMCYGAEGTLLPAGALARSLDNRQYVVTADTVISRSSAGDVLVEPNTITNGATYQVIAGGVSVAYTADGSASAAEITAGLAALFNPLNFLATAANGVLRLRSIDLYSDFTLTVDSKLTITTLSTPVVFTSLDLGAYALPAAALTRMDSSILGWDEVNNPVAGATGRFVETDEELRERHSNSVRVTGAATAQAIRSRLLAEVDSVTYVAIYENRTNVVDEFGTPAHSFEAVISGGLNQAVADKLFEVKPAGIETYGNTSIQVFDENGDVQTCHFSRPLDKFAWIRVTVVTLNEEEVLTSEIIQTIKDAVMAYSDTVGIGEDIITQRFYGPIYDSTSGIGSITVEAALTTTSGGTPTYGTANVSVARAELALFAESRITVVGV